MHDFNDMFHILGCRDAQDAVCLECTFTKSTSTTKCTKCPSKYGLKPKTGGRCESKSRTRPVETIPRTFNSCYIVVSLLDTFVTLPVTQVCQQMY